MKSCELLTAYRSASPLFECFGFLRRGSPQDFKFAAFLITYSVQSKMPAEEPMRTPPLEPPLEGAPPKPPLGDAGRCFEVRCRGPTSHALWTRSSKKSVRLRCPAAPFGQSLPVLVDSGPRQMGRLMSCALQVIFLYSFIFS